MRFFRYRFLKACAHTLFALRQYERAQTVANAALDSAENEMLEEEDKLYCDIQDATTALDDMVAEHDVLLRKFRMRLP